MNPNRILDTEATSFPAFRKGNWTAIIPAAGRGSRLGFSKPKILYPIAGRPILSWLLDSISSVCDHIIIVVSPSGRSDVASYLQVNDLENIQLLEQSEPTGMGDAVLLAEESVNTKYSLVIWGDQVLIEPATLAKCAGVHEDNHDCCMTLATVVRKDPYINLVRDKDQRIVMVQQAREGEINSEVGENDCGLFLFDSEKLFNTLCRCRNEASSIGTSTGEFNLLQTLPAFDQPPARVITIRLDNDVECRGVNDRADAEFAELVLRARKF